MASVRGGLKTLSFTEAKWDDFITGCTAPECFGSAQENHPIAMNGSPMDQATILGYALGYIATLVAVFIFCLPLIIGFGLLMLLAGAVRLILLLATALTVGLARLFRSPTGTPRRTRHGSRLITH